MIGVVLILVAVLVLGLWGAHLLLRLDELLDNNGAPTASEHTNKPDRS